MQWQVWLKKFLWDKPTSLKEIYNLTQQKRFEMTDEKFGKLWNYVLRNIVLCVICFGYGAWILSALILGFVYIPFDEMPWRHVFIDFVQVFFSYRVLVYGINRTAEMLGHKK